MAPVALAGDHRRPPMLVIFFIDVAAAVLRVEGVDPGSCGEAAERARDQQVSRAKAVVDPAPAIFGEAHPRAALQGLRLQLRTRAQVRDQARIVEAGSPSP